MRRERDGQQSICGHPARARVACRRRDVCHTLNFDSTDGIPVGSAVYRSDQTAIPPGSLQVTSVTQGSVQLSGTLSKTVAYVDSGSGTMTVSQALTSSPSSVTFTLKFPSKATNGIAAGRSALGFCQGRAGERGQAGLD